MGHGCTCEYEKLKCKAIWVHILSMPFGIVGVVFHLELRRRKAQQDSYRRGRPSHFKITSSMPAVKHIPRYSSGGSTTSSTDTQRRSCNVVT